MSIGEIIPNHAVILQYHHISDTTPGITSTSPAQFLEHLKYLEENAFNIEPLEKVIAALKDKKQLPDKTVTITFDDAYANIYQTAWPMIKDRGWVFTLFVSTQLIGSNPALYMDWDQVRELHDHGILIANHTRTHTHLLRRREHESEEHWLQRIQQEITGAQDKIIQELGVAKNIFAYPYGEYDIEVKQLLKDLDFTAVGQHSGAVGETVDWQAVPRFPASGVYADLATLKVKLMTLPLPITNPMPNSLLDLQDRRPVLDIKLEIGKFRMSQLNCYATHQGLIEIMEKSATGFRTQARANLAPGRSRYNCTIPTQNGSRFYWFSQPWIRKNEDGSWYPET